MMLRSLCVHGHFYQPPREDPLTGLIPLEPGAAPYSNWNERIHAECYRPNAELGNFEHISFNLGPTLLAWMEHYDPLTHQSIIAQDRANVLRYGVGNAIAQAYNHTILPLATYDDKVTQVIWGIADFEHRFGRKPQGMWLPETAVDLETLSILADQGIEFTILAPWQAEQESLDPTEAYRVALPRGKDISVFFYNRELSTQISFDPVSTVNADAFAQNHVASQFSAEKLQRGEPQLVLIASDGELYGHHQVFRDHFLQRLVDGASAEVEISPTYTALWLKHHPPRWNITLREKTSWSCHHGVMRWMGECPCTPGDGRWKVYLRQAMNRLAATLDKLYAEQMRPWGIDPWQLRNHYIHVLLGQVGPEALIAEAAGRTLDPQDSRRIGLLLEAQHQRQRMFTSCGWFFDDFSRIEPRNNVAYAAQMVYLVRQATGVDLAPLAISALKHVFSHLGGPRGDIVFRRFMRAAENRA